MKYFSKGKCINMIKAKTLKSVKKYFKDKIAIAEIQKHKNKKH